jgi:hypothetical protein
MDRAVPTRHWGQFGLKALLVFVSLCAIPCSWLAVKIKHARDERLAANRVIELQGTVYYDHQEDASGSRAPTPRTPTPAWLTKLVGIDPFSHVTELSIGCDAQLEQLRYFPALEMLQIPCFSNVTDAGLAHLQDAPQLKELSFGVENQLRDGSLANLSRLTRLETLDIQYLNITDEGLRQLQPLTQLRELTVNGTFTDTGLTYLKGMSKLRSLTIYTHGRPRLTPEAKASLAQAIPDCEIDW